MNIDKLKIDEFENINVNNLPKELDLGINTTNKNIDVVIYYIDKISDVSDFVNYVNGLKLPKDNRTILIYKKGRKDVNRDKIIAPFKNGVINGFKFKAPMLCSLSKEYSAFILMKE